MSSGASDRPRHTSPSAKASGLLDDAHLAELQADMRHGYLDGALGVLVSGLAWLSAAAVALVVSDRAGILTLIAGGALIHPLSVLLAKRLGRPGTHAPGNPLARLAGEGTVLLLAGLAFAYAVSTVRPEWFFSVMLLVIGGRYLTFQTLYGLRAYWVCGAALCAAGLGTVFAGAAVSASALSGAVIELATAAALLSQTQRQDAYPAEPGADAPL